MHNVLQLECPHLKDFIFYNADGSATDSNISHGIIMELWNPGIRGPRKYPQNGDTVKRNNESVHAGENVMVGKTFLVSFGVV